MPNFRDIFRFAVLFVVLVNNCFGRDAELCGDNLESFLLEAGENLADESALDSVRLDHYKGLLHTAYSFPRALRPAAVHATRLGSLPSL